MGERKPTKIKKAVIAAAGMGTRFLPQTKAMPKEMLPVIDKPVIQYVVEGLVASGVEQIIIVTGSTKRAIENHFDRNVELEEALEAKGKHEAAKKIRRVGDMANFIYIRQKGTPAGNLRPVLNAAPLLGDEPFYYFFADDFFMDETPTPAQLLEVYNKTDTSVVALEKGAKENVSLYGIADPIEEISDGVYSLKSVVEKPDPEEAPSLLAVGSGYLLTPEIIPIAEKLAPSERGEIEITDAIALLAKTQGLSGRIITGSYHDTGNPLAYLKTQIDIALEHPEYGDEIQKYINKKIKS